MDEEQSLYCTNCSKTLIFETKPEKNGNLLIVCDYCGHNHCRVVVDGEVTGDRWDSKKEVACTIRGVMKNSGHGKWQTSLWRVGNAIYRKVKIP